VNPFSRTSTLESVKTTAAAELTAVHGADARAKAAAMARRLAIELARVPGVTAADLAWPASARTMAAALRIKATGADAKALELVAREYRALILGSDSVFDGLNEEIESSFHDTDGLGGLALWNKDSAEGRKRMEIAAAAQGTRAKASIEKELADDAATWFAAWREAPGGTELYYRLALEELKEARDRDNRGLLADVWQVRDANLETVARIMRDKVLKEAT
jgi:hypothetical protein